jgi:hypothetical protein
MNGGKGEDLERGENKNNKSGATSTSGAVLQRPHLLEEQERRGRGGGGQSWRRAAGWGAMVSTGKGIIYQGNTIRTIGSTIDGRKELGYLGHMGFSAYHFSFSFFFWLHHCEITQQ